MAEKDNAGRQESSGSRKAVDPDTVLDFREQKVEIREEGVAIRERLVELREKSAQRSKWRDPLFLAIVAAFVGLLGNVAVTLVQGSQNLIAQKKKSDLDRGADQDKARSDLILRAIKTDDTETSKKNLDFLIQTGILSDAEGKIEKYIQEKGAPFLPSEAPSGPASPRPSLQRAAMKYREAGESIKPQQITVDELFGWARVPIDESLAADRSGPVSDLETRVLQITGDLYAAQIDGRTGTLRVMIAAPGHAGAPERLVILAVPDPTVGGGSLIHNPQPYWAARESLLKSLGLQTEALPQQGFNFNLAKHNRVTAIGFAFYNPYYLHYQRMDGHPGKIGAWQLSPVWSVTTAQ
jgi:hypothetical protein